MAEAEGVVEVLGKMQHETRTASNGRSVVGCDGGCGGVAYALKPFGTHPNLSFVLELHNEWALRDQSREQGQVWDSGGTTILLSSGLFAELTPQFSAFWAMPVPVYQNLGGQHEELTYEVITGCSWHF